MNGVSGHRWNLLPKRPNISRPRSAMAWETPILVRSRWSMSGEAELWTLLKGVSRSFYLSVRFLPSRIRMAIALGYLLARASDTIADTNELPPAERIEFLHRFLRAIVSREPGDPLDLATCLMAQAEGPEKVLVANIDRVMGCLAKIPPAQQALVHEVLTKIIHGQTLDIERFESKPGVHGLADDSELEEYIYLVAGCVGEFWTKICLLEWSNYARLRAEEMLVLGKNFGNGLQLVNILRDYPVDLKAGRSYLPVSIWTKSLWTLLRRAGSGNGGVNGRSDIWRKPGDTS